ncbi:sugar ABC transporter ATP-binding protein [Sporosarcina sp. CAU 1771]
MKDSTPLLELKNINKSFGNIHVLKDINLEIKPGEVHVLLGENGAGKSTLIKILTGAYSKDSGDMYWSGEKTVIKSPIDAMDIGISAIYQELNLIPELTVYENIFLGNELKITRGGITYLDRKEMKRKSKEFLKVLGQDISPDTVISTLGVGKQQLVEIAKAFTVNARLIIMDEPTSSLSESESSQLLETIEKLRTQGIAIIYISHRLEEIIKIGDTLSVLRDGNKIKTLKVKDTNTDEMIKLMVGRDLKEQFPKVDFVKGKEGLRVENMKLMDSPHSISFTAYEGEILGISGLVGAGRTELARGIFGADKIDSGEVFVFGEKVSIKTPRDAIAAGLAFITEDRKSEGLILEQDLEFNMTLASLKRFKGSALLQRKTMKKTAQEYIKELQVRPGNMEQHAVYLSGGNQQKVVIAKWLCTKAKVFIFDEPTRGIDVGAKVEVYRLLNELVSNGAIVIIISSELPEILGVSDRVLVLHEGKLTADMMREDASQEKIMKAATGEI